MYGIINFLTEFFSKKLSKNKESIFIQFILFGLFGAASVFTYIPKDTEPLTIVIAIILFWIILYIIIRVLRYLKIF